MYQTLQKLPAQVLLDTNVLLDAAFVRDGAARKAVELLPSLGFRLNIDMLTDREAKKVLGRYALRPELRFNPADVLDEFIRASRIFTIPPALPVAETRVNRADRYLANAARQYGAWILSGDAPFAMECQQIGIAVRFPWDVVLEDAFANGQEPELRQVIRVTPMSRDSGSIFGRVMTGAWAGTGALSRHTVCHVENVGRILYDLGNNVWVFKTPMGDSVKIECPIGPSETWAVCASYRFPDSRGEGTLLLRVAKSPANSLTESREATTLPHKTGPGRASFGSSLGGRDYWNGHLRCIVISRHQVKAETWKAIVSISDAAPNPYDADALGMALLGIGGNHTWL
jgi:predicted nucleic acid-binding protein